MLSSAPFFLTDRKIIKCVGICGNRYSALAKKLLKTYTNDFEVLEVDLECTSSYNLCRPLSLPVVMFSVLFSLFVTMT